MKYTVKNEDGELTFDSLAHLRQMYMQGLVEPEDQVRAEDSQLWRKASAIPELREFAANHSSGSSRWLVWGLVSACCLSTALYAVVKLHSWLIAAVLMLPVLVMTQRAFVQTMRRDRG